MTDTDRTFKIRPSLRYTMVGSGLLVTIMPLALFALSYFDGPFIFSFTLALIRQQLLPNLLIVIVMTGLGLYITLYWLTYAVRLDDEGITRSGISHLVDRRGSVKYSDVQRVTRGTRYFLKIIPATGRPLATNIKELEDGPEELIYELRRRLPAGVVDGDLEWSIGKHREEDRFGWVLPIAIIFLAGVTYSSFAIADWAIAQVAWDTAFALGEDTEALASAAGPDGSLWVISERDDSSGADLSRFKDGELQETIRLEDHPVLQEVIDELGGVTYVQSLLVDDLGQVWLLLRAGGEVYKWGGGGWSREPLIFESKEYQPTDIQLGTGRIWGSLPDTVSIVSIDPATGDTGGLTLKTELDDGRVVELTPQSMASLQDGGLLVGGPINLGGDGLLRLDADQSVSLFTSVLGQPVDPSWRMQLSSGDVDGNIHVLYTSRGACDDDERLIRLGTRFQSAEWVWNDLVYQDDCESGPYQESFVIDPLGRVWAQSGSTGVFVFPPPQVRQVDSATLPIEHYSNSNSGFNEAPLEMVGNQILAIHTFYGSAIGIDANSPDLPNPVPKLLEPIFDAPYLIGFLLLPALFMLIWIQQRPNRSD